MRAGTAEDAPLRALAISFARSFRSIQFNAGLISLGIVGVVDVGADSTGRSASRGPLFADLVLRRRDLNRAPPKTQSALLEAMQDARSPSTANATRCRLFHGDRDAQ